MQRNFPLMQISISLMQINLSNKYPLLQINFLRMKINANQLNMFQTDLHSIQYKQKQFSTVYK